MEGYNYFKEAYLIQKEIGSRGYMALSQSNMADLAVESGNYEEAARNSQEALALYQEIGDQLGVAFCLNIRSKLAGIRGIMSLQ